MVVIRVDELGRINAPVYGGASWCNPVSIVVVIELLGPSGAMRKFVDDISGDLDDRGKNLVSCAILRIVGGIIIANPIGQPFGPSAIVSAKSVQVQRVSGFIGFVFPDTLYLIN